MGQTHHAISYIELAAGDVEAAKAFYAGAFGWEFTDYGPEYAGIKGPDGEEVGGLNGTADAGSGGPLVLLYSDDLAASQTAVTTAGGTITRGPYEYPGGHRFHFTDPSGNELGVFATS
ncbi:MULTISPECIES: VOC family protein [unclassified Knoellia]|uniref:VOC family protein n=1 Tax=Knoellia altitudinis TaxID=3404795 RepID=UPI003608FAC6